MADGSVQLPLEGTGKKVDNSELTRADLTVVERQRIVVADDLDPTQQARVLGGALMVSQGYRDNQLAEIHYIEQLEQSYYLRMATERHSGDRAGLEIR